MPPKAANINKAATSQFCVASCVGCQENQPNQLAHMAYGGCLYDDVRSDDSGTPDQKNKTKIRKNILQFQPATACQK